VLIPNHILSEYSEVLHRPKFNFEEEKVAAILDYIMYRGQAVAPSLMTSSLPDPDDEPFLETALACHAACLVTGNQSHFPAELCQGIKVISPKEFALQGAQPGRVRNRAPVSSSLYARQRSFCVNFMLGTADLHINVLIITEY
jgi:predicted nucleic acid-binding protein